MKKAPLALIAVALGMLIAVPLWAGVKVTTAPEPLEKSVAFRMPDGRYVMTMTGGFLNFGGDKVGSRQIFSIIDLNGNDLADGDTVKVRYTPHSSQPADQVKSSYWVETPDGVKRGSEGSVFKIKVVDTKYVFQAPSGKFMTGTVKSNVIGLSDKQADALLLDFIDVSSGAPKAPKKAAAPAAAAPAPDKTAAE